jgi:hypothetical protein
MKYTILFIGMAALAVGCANSRPPTAPPAQTAGYAPTIDRAPSDDRYDNPGALPANSGGTDAGRLGTDERYEPVLR